MQTGARLGRYEIVGRIGAGGMGEVYKARDETLQRFVALKILPSNLVRDTDRVRRFQQEARAASALNHPHILHIYDIGEALVEGEAVHYIAMELVEGDTLRALLQQGTDLRHLLECLAQVADALAKAHSAGIVHRDLKPENIMVTADGYAKLLDFGLAKLLEPALPSADTNAPTIHHGTEPGRVMGTIAYMAPEQVSGKPVDSRSDIFAFGAILYEAVTGRRAFSGQSSVDVMHAVVYSEPDPIATEGIGMMELERLVRKCVAKQPEKRYQSSRDIAIDLRDVRQQMSSLGSGRFATPGPRPRWWLIAAVFALIALTSAVLFVTRRPARDSRAEPAAARWRAERFPIQHQPREVTISPDGRYVAYTASASDGTSIWLRQRATTSSIRLVGPTKWFTHRLSFSRDGEHLFYLTWRSDQGNHRQALYKVPILGGRPSQLVDDVVDASVATRSGRIAYIRQIPKRPWELVIYDGSSDRVVVELKPTDFFNLLAWSIDETLLGGTAKIEGKFYVGTWSLQTGFFTPIGRPWTRVASLTWDPDGTAFIVSGSQIATEPTQIWRISYAGGEATRLTNDANVYVGAYASADGRTIATAQTHWALGLWTASRDQPDAARRTTVSAVRNSQPIWTPDGRIVYVTDVGGSRDLWIMQSDGSNASPLVESPDPELSADVSPDGKSIVWATRSSDKTDLRIRDLIGGNPRQLTRCNCYGPRFAADGRSIVYTSYDAGPEHVWRISLDTGEATQLGDAIARDPRPSPNGQRLLVTYYKQTPGPPLPAILRASDGQLIHVIEDAPQNSRYEWSDDDKILYLDSEASNISNIYEHPLSGKGRPVTRYTSDGVFEYDYDHRNRMFVMTRGTENTEVILLRRSDQ